MVGRFLRKYGNKEVNLKDQIPTIDDHQSWGSGSVGYLTAVRVRNNKFEYYHNWWAGGWQTEGQLIKDYPDVMPTCIQQAKSQIQQLIW